MLETNRKRTHKMTYQRSVPKLWETQSQQVKKNAPFLNLDDAVCPTLNDASVHSDILQDLDLDAPAGPYALSTSVFTGC